ncbi:MAG: SH3 domain-containing protein [Cyclobacteriaceae bacterium]
MKSLFVLLSLLVTIQWTYVINSGVNLRKGPDNKKRVLTTVPEGEKINVLEKTNQWWWQVEYKGTKGYIASSFISRSYPKTAFKLIKANPIAAFGLLLLGVALIYWVVPGKASDKRPAKSGKKKKATAARKKK